MSDKVAVVTGSNKGIGFAIATGLAREGARVILNGRSEEAVAKAKSQIAETVPNARIETFAGDLSDQDVALIGATQRPVAELAFSEPSGPPAWSCWTRQRYRVVRSTP